MSTRWVWLQLKSQLGLQLGSQLRLSIGGAILVGVLLVGCNGVNEEIVSQGKADGATPNAASAAVPKLVPFEKFFVPTAYHAPQLSPDGRWLSWIAPSNGVNNFFVAPTDNLAKSRQLTFKQQQGIRPTDVSGVVLYKWSADSRYVIYPHDYAGDENWDIWRVDVNTGEEKNLTPSPDKSYEIVQVSQKVPVEIAVTAQTFGQHDWVLYRVNLDTGVQVEVARAEPGILGVVVDHDLKPAALLRAKSAVDYELLALHNGQRNPIHTVTAENVGALSASTYQKIIRVSRDNKKVYFYDSTGRNTNALVGFDLETGNQEVVGADDKVDLGGVLYDPGTLKPIAYMAEWIRRDWHALDQSLVPDLTFLAEKFSNADYRIVSQSDDNKQWVVQYMPVDYPTHYQLYQRKTKRLTELAIAAPEMLNLRLSKTYPTEMNSSDGLPLVSYYTLPIGSDSNNDGIPDKPLPMVMLVHGGPSDERASYGFSPVLQWLTNRGYVVYNMNYRGSAGFGKKYFNAANGEWGGKMHRDLLEQLDALIAKGVVDKDRVAILGGSYGGYATLVGMTMTPDRFACGVPIVGPSNVMTPMPHWSPEFMAISLGGDPRTEEGVKKLRSISPVTHAHKTKGAVLVGQGANDSRVPQAQSDQIVDIMNKAGAKVTYVVYGDEGHGFLRKENQHSFWGITEVFLAQCLGGRSESIGNKLQGASLSVPVGAKHIPGLQQALAKQLEISDG